MHAQTTTTPARLEICASAFAARRDALAQPSRPLAEVLEERNLHNERINSEGAETARELTAADTDPLDTLEDTIFDAPCATFDDAVAKLALVADYYREGLVPDEATIASLKRQIAEALDDAGDIFRIKLHPPRGRRWSLIATQFDTVPEARVYAAE